MHRIIPALVAATMFIGVAFAAPPPGSTTTPAAKTATPAVPATPPATKTVAPPATTLAVASALDNCYVDADGDGYGSGTATARAVCEENEVLNADDCDDADENVHPGATEVPGDDIDNDCNGAVYVKDVPAHQGRMHGLGDWEVRAEEILETRITALNAETFAEMEVIFTEACEAGEDHMDIPSTPGYVGTTTEAFANFMSVCWETGHMEVDDYGEDIYVLNASMEYVLVMLEDLEDRLAKLELKHAKLKLRVKSNTDGIKALTERVDDMHNVYFNVGGTGMFGGEQRFTLDLGVDLELTLSEDVAIGLGVTAALARFNTEREPVSPGIQFEAGLISGNTYVSGGYQFISITRERGADGDVDVVNFGEVGFARIAQSFSIGEGDWWVVPSARIEMNRYGQFGAGAAVHFSYACF